MIKINCVSFATAVETINKEFQGSYGCVQSIDFNERSLGSIKAIGTHDGQGQERRFFVLYETQGKNEGQLRYLSYRYDKESGQWEAWFDYPIEDRSDFLCQSKNKVVICFIF